MLNEGEFVINIYVVENIIVFIEYKDVLKLLVVFMSKKIGECLGKSKGVFKIDFFWIIEVKFFKNEFN